MQSKILKQTRNLVHVCGYSWVQSVRLLGACMRKRLGACMRMLGAKYAVVVCKVCGCCVQSMRLLGACVRKRLGACMRLLGASLTAADSLPDSR